LANRLWTAPSIRRAARSLAIGPREVIVNFNYDYYFLRDLFPNNPLITVINDDFISRALPLCRETLHQAQRLTCRASDAVLTPSVVLQEQLQPYCDPQLFLPWADTPFRRPTAGGVRDTILYWGFIDWRLDYPFMESLARRLRHEAPEVKLLFVGPTERGSDQQALFREHPNVKLHPASKLDALPLDRIFASVIPFLGGVEGCDAIVMPNKAFQLLARGMPLLVTGMPRFARESFVFRLDEGDAVVSILQAREQFESLQPAMQSFIDGNGPSSRLEQFLRIVGSARSARG
jgi:glycosyltransferase involved in cell wall biosynthesis